jgi:hypothetical protein
MPSVWILWEKITFRGTKDVATCKLMINRDENICVAVWQNDVCCRVRDIRVREDVE